MQKRSLSTEKAEKKKKTGVRKRYIDPSRHLGKAVSSDVSTSIPVNIYFQVTRWCAVRLWYFLQMHHVNPRVCYLEFGSTKVVSNS